MFAYFRVSRPFWTIWHTLCVYVCMCGYKISSMIMRARINRFIISIPWSIFLDFFIFLVFNFSLNLINQSFINLLIAKFVQITHWNPVSDALRHLLAFNSLVICCRYNCAFDIMCPVWQMSFIDISNTAETTYKVKPASAQPGSKYN